jgi:hypothetical protein
MHIIAILLFPVRLVTVPIVAPIIDALVCAVSQLGGGTQLHFWDNLLPVAGMWIIWPTS